MNQSVNSNNESSPHPQGTVIAPDQIVSALIGADFVVLHGFGEPQSINPLVPTVSKFDVTKSAPAMEKARQVRFLISGVTILVAVSCVGALTFWTVALRSDPVAPKTLSWKVDSVGKNNVLVRMGNSTIEIPVGSILPNGEILRGVDAVRQNYFTDTQVVIIKK